MKELHTYIITFKYLVEMGSINKACQSLNITDKTLKKRVKSLENYLNRSLVIFERQEAIISSDGMSIYAAINTSLEQIDQNLNFFTKSISTEQKYRLRILVPPGSALLTYQYILPALEQDMPNVKVKIDSYSYNFLAQHGDYLQTFLENYDIISIDQRLMSMISKHNWTTISRFSDVQYLYAHRHYLSEHPINDITSLSSARLLTIENALDNGKLLMREKDSHRLEAIEFSTITQLENGLSANLLTTKALGVGVISEVILNSVQDNDLIPVLPEWTLEYCPTYEMMYQNSYQYPEVLEKVLKTAKPYYSALTTV